MVVTNVLFIWKPRSELKEYLGVGLGNIENLNLVFPNEDTEDELLTLVPNVNMVLD